MNKIVHYDFESMNYQFNDNLNSEFGHTTYSN
jgi:hypothetical protein